MDEDEQMSAFRIVETRIDRLRNRPPPSFPITDAVGAVLVIEMNMNAKDIIEIGRVC